MPSVLVIFLSAVTKYVMETERRNLFGLIVRGDAPSWQGKHGSRLLHGGESIQQLLVKHGTHWGAESLECI